MRRRVSLSLLIATLGFALAATQPPQRVRNAKAAVSSFGNADAITTDELKVYDYFLASDELEGRYLPSRGYDTAALFVAAHLAEWGLTPMGSTTGTNGPLQPYFMPFDLVSTQLVPAEMKATLVLPPNSGGGRGRGAPARTGPVDFAYGSDWTMAAGGRGAPPVESADIHAAPLVFVGNGYVIPKSNLNPYQGLNVQGKVLVVAGLPPAMAAAANAGRGGRGGANPICGALAPGQTCTDGKDFTSPEYYAAHNGALGVITIADFQALSAMQNPAGGRGPVAPSVDPAMGNDQILNGGTNATSFQVAAFQTAREASVPQINAGLEFTNAIFQGEKLSAAQIFDGAAAGAQLASFDLNPAKTLTLHVATRTEHAHAENVIAVLPGSDPVLKNEYVVMSAHLDHIGLTNPQAPGNNGDGINNGADDDGSGSTGLLGIAHAFATGRDKGMVPKRTMIFLWNAGEERGLWGSEYFNRFPPVDIHKIVVDLNMDMIGRDRTPGYQDPQPTYKLIEPGKIFLVGPDVSSSELEATIEDVNNRYQKFGLDHFYDTTAPDATHDNLGPQPNGQRIFYRSDHYNFAKNGIPIAFFSDGLHVDYHRVSDSPDKIDFGEIQSVSKTVAALAWVIGNEPEGATPKINAPDKLPEQLKKDMQTAQEQGWGKLTPVLPPLPGEPF